MRKNEFNPKWTSAPGDTIKDILQDKKKDKKTLGKELQLSSFETEDLLIGRKNIDLKLAERLSISLGGSIDFWLNREENYRLDLIRLKLTMLNNFLIQRNDPQVIKNLNGQSSYTIKYTEPLLTLIKESLLKDKLKDDKITFVSEKLYSDEFLDRVDEIVKKIYDLGFAILGQVILAKIHNETAGTYSPIIINNKGFVGLIQFSIEIIEYQKYFNAVSKLEMINNCFNQSNVEQLEQVEKYLIDWLLKNKNNFIKNKFPVNQDGKIIIDPATIYCLTFLPAFAYKPINTDLAKEWEQTGQGRTAKDLISRNPGLSPDGQTIPKSYLAQVLKDKTKYSF